MQDAFEQAALAIFTADSDAFDEILRTNPGVARHRAKHGHPTLLQMVACEEANVPNVVDVATRLINAGAPTAEPLVAAAGCNAPQTLMLILDHGESVDGEREWTPLDEAIYWVQPDMIRVLIERGASQGRLRRAAGLGTLDALASFFAGTDHSAASLRDSAGPIASPFDDTIDDITKDDPQSIINHAFVMAVNSGHRATAEWLLDRGAQIDARPAGYHWRGTALHAAIWRGETNLVEWLLDRGADPSILDGLANSNALGWARHHDHDHIVELLESRAG